MKLQKVQSLKKKKKEVEPEDNDSSQVESKVDSSSLAPEDSMNDVENPHNGRKPGEPTGNQSLQK